MRKQMRGAWGSNWKSLLYGAVALAEGITVLWWFRGANYQTNTFVNGWHTG